MDKFYFNRCRHMSYALTCLGEAYLQQYRPSIITKKRKQKLSKLERILMPRERGNRNVLPTINSFSPFSSLTRKGTGGLRNETKN